MTTNLVVADLSRTEKTICLAVSPSLKAYGISGRARLFEVIQRVEEVNRVRKWKGEPLLEYITATPRMALYIDYSTRVYSVYLKYIAPEDIHVYSIDEVFIDATQYLKLYKCTAHELAMRIIRDVLATTGITATAGIGTNMYLCKVAMDIVAKHIPADADGVRIAELDEMTYRRTLWSHKPLTDFWRMGRGTEQRLSLHGMYTMGDIARQSVRNEEVLYRLFGVNAELLIDHAWGWEPCTMAMIKAYKPEEHSLSTGQVLSRVYTPPQARVVISEMADGISMDMLDKRLAGDKVTITISGDQGHIHGTEAIGCHTSSSALISKAVLSLYDKLVPQKMNIRRLNITVLNVISEAQAERRNDAPQQLDLFDDAEAVLREREAVQSAQKKERRMQEALLNIRNTHGKNAILRGISFDENATGRERNNQIGGHRA